MPTFGTQRKLIVYTDVPPLGNEGVSMSVLAHRIIASLEPNVIQVITRAYSRKYLRAEIGVGLQAPTLLSWDCGGLGLRFLKGATRSLVDALLLRAWSRLAYRPPGENRPSELVGLSGPHWQFLPRLRDLARALGLPYSVYVIDDYEVTAAHAGADEHALKTCRKAIGSCLQDACRVYSICPGMVERLQTRYGIKSHLLYPIADTVPTQTVPPRVDSRVLLYVGSLGPAYLDTIISVANMLAAGFAPGWRLKVISQDHRTFARHLAGRPEVIGRHDCDREQLRGEVANSEVTLIPYSFEERWKTTAETSFPSKFMDAIGAQKPIIIFAPAYASISRHMRDADGDFLVETSDACGEVLSRRPWQDDHQWLETYTSMHGSHHSPAAARRAFGFA